MSVINIDGMHGWRLTGRMLDRKEVRPYRCWSTEPEESW
jgi:hypothetical protein